MSCFMSAIVCKTISFFFHWPSFSNVYTKQSVVYLFNKSLLVMEIEAAGAHVDDRAR